MPVVTVNPGGQYGFWPGGPGWLPSRYGLEAAIIAATAGALVVIPLLWTRSPVAAERVTAM